MSKWDEQFAPVLAQGREVREGQRSLGNAIIEVVEKGGNLIAEASTGTGKSYATLIPVITAIRKAKSKDSVYRGVVSTETLTLQDQIFRKDIPALIALYPGFTYTKLMGRSNYLCFNAADENKIGVAQLDRMVETLKARADNLGDGEKRDVDRVLGYEVSQEDWDKISGSATFCGDNQCVADVCYSSKARKRAKEADIVVVNHAVLATDLEIRSNAAPESAGEDGLLGTFETLIVDEGHQLAPVLVDQWTKEITQWEITALGGAMASGIELAQTVYSNHSIAELAEGAIEDLTDSFNSIKKFYSFMAERENQEWKNYNTPLCLKYITGMPPQYFINAMNDYEKDTPVRLKHVDETLEKVISYLQKAKVKADIEKIKKRKKINKGLRSAAEMLENVRILSQALETKDGIISQYGIYGVSIKGWERRDGSQEMKIRMVPMDVSGKAQYLFHNKTNILVSATLTDLTDGTFRYAKACTGFPSGAKELRVTTPFDMDTQQLIYMTPATGKRVDHLRGAQFDFQELVRLIKATKGRSLVLFTSREELDWAANEVKSLQAMNLFDYPILVQEKESNKMKLMEEFKSVTDSVLFATKSFFVGIDVPGESLSGVWLCKWTNPQYTAECRQQVTYWKKRGFPNWYAREALTIFQQASGRLIRSSGCKGVVGVLDFRVSDPKDNVYKTAKIGVDAVGSPVTIHVEAVEAFFAAA